MSEVVLILGMAKHIPDSLKSMDMIGVDHGALLCVQNHVKMVGAIGDFDSVSKQEYEWISSESEVVRLPEKKMKQIRRLQFPMRWKKDIKPFMYMVVLGKNGS